MQELRSMAVIPELAPGLGLGARARRPGPYRGSGPSGRHLLAALRLSSSWAGRAQGRLAPRQRHRTPPGPPGSASKGWPVSCLWLSRASYSRASARLGRRPSPGGDARTAGSPVNNAWRTSVQTGFMAAVTQPRLPPKPFSPSLASARLPLRCVTLTLLWRQPVGGSPSCKGLGPGALDPDGSGDRCGTAIGDRR